MISQGKTPGDQIMVALDLPSRPQREALLEALGSRLKRVKVGSVLFSQEGPEVLRELRARDLGLFLDLKFHDIPNTVCEAVRAACQQAPIEFLTVHALGGSRMIEAVRHMLDREGLATQLLAVTVLTSHTESDVQALGLSGGISDHVLRLARLSVEAGTHGLVCSPWELSSLAAEIPKHILRVTPGIRAEAQAGSDDQRRTATAKEALAWGADYLVVGRPLLQAENPARAFDDMVASVA